MTETAISLRLPKAVKKDLDWLAKATKRSRSYLVNEAISDYLQRERAIVDGIQRARAELKAGKGISLDEAMAIVDRAIDGASSS